jgi:hypothetical protein
MLGRKIAFRSLVCAGPVLALALASFVWIYTNPAQLRVVVQESLSGRFAHVIARIGSARLRLLGGTQIQELRLARSDSLEQRDFLYVPKAVIFHDKELLLDGRLAIRKIELDRPELRLVRERDGSFNLVGLLKPGNPEDLLPIFVLRQGTIIIEDRTCTPALTLLEIRNVDVTAINDPLPTVRLTGSGHAEMLGEVRFRVVFSRVTHAAKIDFEFPAINVGPEMIERVAQLRMGANADWIKHMQQASGRINLKGFLQSPGRGAEATSDQGGLRYQVQFGIHEGRFNHEKLPSPMTRIEMDGVLSNGLIPTLRGSAEMGRGSGEVTLTNFRLCPKILADPNRPKGFLELLEALSDEIDFHFRNLSVDDELGKRLNEDLRALKDQFSPTGSITVHYRYHRPDSATEPAIVPVAMPRALSWEPAVARPGLVKLWTVQFNGISGMYNDFRYPVHDVRGVVRVNLANAPLRDVHIDVTGRAGNAPMRISGTMKGDKRTGEMVLDIESKNALLDDRVYNALAPKIQDIAKKFLPLESRRVGLAAYPMGHADIRVAIRRLQGSEKTNRAFTIDFKDSEVYFDQFPYPWEKVNGRLIVYPDRWECRDVRGTHNGGNLLVSAESIPSQVQVQGAQDRSGSMIRAKIRGEHIVLDREFEQGLVPLNSNERQSLQNTWRMLQLTGKLNFEAEVIDHPDRPRDLAVGVTINGCRLQPSFFDYPMEQVQAKVQYGGGRVWVRDFQARHGAGRLAMDLGVIQIRPEVDGAFTAWLRGLSGTKITPDVAFLRALPESLRRVFENLKMRTPVDLGGTLTLSSPGTGKPMELWWEGAVALDQGSLRAGLEFSEVTGKVWCKGYYDGRRIRGLNGQVQLAQAKLPCAPMSNIQMRLELEPLGQDYVLRLRDLNADLFGGTLAGQGRLEIGDARPLRYELDLEALSVRLEKVGQHNFAGTSAANQLEGPARAALHLSGEGNDLLGLKGNGRIDVVQGKMGELPILLDVVKAFGFRMPDRTAFEEARLVYGIEGSQLVVRQLELLGNAFSLHGQGKVDIDGNNLALDFHATPGRVTQFLPNGVDLIPEFISGQLLKLKMRGSFSKQGKLKFEKELMPTLFEPIKRTIGWSGWGSWGE